VALTFVVELSGLEVFALAKEVDSGVRGAYVKNVYSLGASQVLRFGAPGAEDTWVVASSKYGVWVSKRVSERAETTTFTTRLRQELVRAKFASASQMDDDRVFELSFGEEEQARHFIVELMPPGNMLVTDQNHRVLVALREVRSPARRLVRGSVYSPPPQRRKSPREATAKDVAEAVSKESTAGGAIGRHFSLPRKYVAEVLARLGLREESESLALKGRQGEVAGVLVSLVRDARSAPHPCLCETPKGDEVFVVSPLEFKVRERKSSVSEICDEFFLGPASSEPFSEEVPSDAKWRELEATISRLRDQETGLRAEASKLREMAAKAREAVSVQEARKIMDSAGVHDRRELESREAVASALFDRAKEVERKAEDAENAAANLSKKKKPAKVGRPRRTVELKKRRQEWYEKFRWFFTSGGRLAIGGRDAQSNSILVRRHIETNDTVYHADLFGSPFFVLKGGREQTEEECAEVAQATVSFSSAWKTGLGSADAYWVNSDQVSAAAPSGEFLPRGGFMITGKKSPVPHNLVELAVGIDLAGRVVSGPEGALRKGAVVYVVLRPQKEKSSDTAKRVLKDLEALAKNRIQVRASVDDVIRALPTGGGKVLRKYSVPADTLQSRNA
jgi:predicted ribosome quality control (RQC) complex YloA/Tae2 family protein